MIKKSGSRGSRIHLDLFSSLFSHISSEKYRWRFVNLNRFDPPPFPPNIWLPRQARPLDKSADRHDDHKRGIGISPHPCSVTVTQHIRDTNPTAAYNIHSPV